MSAPVLRASAVRTVARLGTDEDLEILLQIAPVRRRFLQRGGLPEGSPHVIAALKGLRQTWSTDERAKRVLASAKASSDPDIRRALADATETAAAS
jgi:hypothetical protein